MTAILPPERQEWAVEMVNRLAVRIGQHDPSPAFQPTMGIASGRCLLSFKRPFPFLSRRIECALGETVVPSRLLAHEKHRFNCAVLTDDPTSAGRPNFVPLDYYRIPGYSGSPDR